LGVGVGLNAKYAMAFFVGSLAIWMVADKGARALLKDPRLWAGLVFGLLAIAPNLLWNLDHKFATFAHTADNAKWGGSLLNVGKGFEFLASQAAVFGPILLVVLVAVLRDGWREGVSAGDRMMLCFTLPVLFVITGQAFVSRAHANWAATAYVAGTLLVVAALLKPGRERWLRASFAFHIAVLLLLSIGTMAAGRFQIPGFGDPFDRTLGWKEIAERTEAKLAAARAGGRRFDAVITDERALTAELLYYLRGESTPVLAFQAGPRPLDHYEMTRPLPQTDNLRVLLVGMRPEERDSISSRFDRKELIATEAVPAGRGRPRTVRFVALEGYRGGR
ncbi:MAG: glycosyltransferase family 39 protein, partial [Proteobacteria bacterium]|nr:glycosyltransferase family 39 protein [Pseudomonadota bacterium]